ncbi:acetolactate synthase large subunit [Kangiella sp. TOML190]|uniref:acetolactate synthase large subunit n=1 Tax=Kangiella sp. TOML190 TaxID=2931351 RepID=UPI0020422FC3|nr:acetolactate synthase large subunit [Kangiella sp. TOML190]
MQASDLLVKCLEEEGIEYIFGVPGEENADFMMSLEKSNKIQFILTRHEQGAAFMAEAYGRLTGNPAGCLGTLGPGATNLITGVANSNMDRAPMLVLTGQGSTTRLHKESHQAMDVVEMFKPVTKWAVSISHQDNIPEITRKAVRLARTEKPGAVLIELPENIAHLPSDKTPIKPIRYRRSNPDKSVVAQAAQKIVAAKRPIIVAGNGCIRKRASNSLRQLCELTGIGVISTFMGKGAVDLDSEHCLFTIGLGAKDLTACALDASDLIIMLGYDMVEYHPHLWNENTDKNIIHIDFLPAEIDEHYNPQLELIGDLANALDMLREALAEYELDFDFSQQQAVRRDMLVELAEHKDDTSEGKIKPQKCLWDLRKALNPEDIVLSDVGAHKMWIARHYHCHEPNTCLIPNGFCSMGFALPGSIGASLVYPDRNIVAVCGDAGFMMNVQEMETARRLNSNIIAIVWEDNAYGLIEWKQDTEFGRHTPLSFGNPDWMQLAEAFVWTGYFVKNSADFSGVLNEALQHSGPRLIVLPVDYDENPKLTEKLGKIVCPI